MADESPSGDAADGSSRNKHSTPPNTKEIVPHGMPVNRIDIETIDGLLKSSTLLPVAASGGVA